MEGREPAIDHRGRVRRIERSMPDAEARRWLQQRQVIHVATTGSDGWPSVVPLVFFYPYPGDETVYFHTGAQEGH